MKPVASVQLFNIILLFIQSINIFTEFTLFFKWVQSYFNRDFVKKMLPHIFLCGIYYKYIE